MLKFQHSPSKWSNSSHVPDQKVSKYTLLQDGQGQKIFGESFDFRSSQVPTLFHDTIFQSKPSKHKLDPTPFILKEKEWERNRNNIGHQYHDLLAQTIVANDIDLSHRIQGRKSVDHSDCVHSTRSTNISPSKHGILTSIEALSIGNVPTIKNSPSRSTFMQGEYGTKANGTRNRISSANEIFSPLRTKQSRMMRRAIHSKPISHDYEQKEKSQLNSQLSSALPPKPIGPRPSLDPSLRKSPPLNQYQISKISMFANEIASMSDSPKLSHSRRCRSSISSRERLSSPVIIQKNISGRSSDWRKYGIRNGMRADPKSTQETVDDPRVFVIGDLDNNLKWDSGTCASMKEQLPLIEEQVKLPSGRTRKQIRRASEANIHVSSHELKKLKRFVNKEYPTLLERNAKRNEEKHRTLSSHRRREEEIMRFGGKFEKIAKKPKWKPSLFVNDKELESRDQELLQKSLANSQRKLKRIPNLPKS